MPKQMASKYPGRCRHCQLSIAVGDEILFVDSKEVYHYECRPSAYIVPKDPRVLGQDGLLFVDLETGGLDTENCAVCQLAGIATSNNFVIQDSFNIKIYPGRLAISERATEVHGMTKETLANEPSEARALLEFANWAAQFKNYRFAGYKCDFDLKFLYAMYQRQGFTDRLYELPPFDVLPIAQTKLNRLTVNHKLVTVANYFEIKSAGAHNALNDLYMTVQAARALENFEVAA